MRRVKVRRRNAPAALGVPVILLIFSLIMFLNFARPEIKRLEVRLDETPAPAVRVTRDVTFEAMNVHLLSLARAAEESAARVEAARYAPRGAAGYLYFADPAFHVLGAPYTDLEEARKVAAQLKELENIDCQVVSLSAGAALLRVTATEEQLSALTAAERALREGTDALNERALAIDRGTEDAVSVRARLIEDAARSRAARGRLSRAAGDKANNVAEKLMDLLESLTLAQTKLSESDDTPLFFSGRIKYNCIDLRARHIDFLNELNGAGE